MDKVGIVAFSSLVGTTAYLGYWQYNRYFWKLDLIADRQRQLQLPVMPLSDNAAAPECARVSISGEFNPEHTLFLAPRPSPVAANGPNTTSGAYVLTLFTQSNGNQIFVNRGWIPRDKMDQKMIPCPTGLQTLVGICAAKEEPNAFSIDHSKAPAQQLFWLDTKTLGQRIGLDTSALVIDEIDNSDEDSAASVLIRKSVDNYTDFHITPWKHATYSATWFILTLCGVLMTRIRFKKL